MTIFKALLPKLVTALFVISAASALGVTPAQAEQYLFSTSFGPSALGLAVNQSTGDVYAANAGAGTVEAFEPSGTPNATTPQLLNAAGTEPFAFSFPFGVAVDNASTSVAKGDVYVANYGAGAVDQFNLAGDATAVEITEASIPLADQGNGTFSPTGVAVGSTGDVYVGDNSNSVIDEFSSTGTFVAQFGAGSLANIQLLATGSGNDVYVGAEQGIVEFTSTGACVNSCTPVVASAHTGIALDSTGDLFAGEESLVSEYGPSGTLLQQFGGATTQPPFNGLASAFGIAVNDTTHGIYVAAAGAVDLFLVPLAKTEPASAVGETSTPGEAAATLNGSVDPEGENLTECKFEYGTEESYGQEAPCGQVPTGSTFVPVSAKIAHLQPRTTYHYRLLTNGPRGIARGFDQSFYTFARPAVTAAGTPFTNVGSSSATLHGKLDPGGASTQYHFEYATETEYEATKTYSAATPTASAGAGSETVGVLATIEGLQPNTVYHFRLVASNTHGPTTGADESFSTFPVGTLGLPDDRGYEIVSPLNNGDATVLLSNAGAAVRAAADGSAVTYAGTAPPVGGNGETPNEITEKRHGSNLYLARRSGPGGWTAADIQPNSELSASHAASARYLGFSSDLSTGFLGSERPLASDGAADGEEGPDALYSRASDGSYGLLAENASYAGSTPDGNHALAKSATGLYDTVGGQLAPVSVLPDRTSAPDAVFGSELTGYRGQSSLDLDRVISEDGSRIFWTDTTTGDLYVRENDSQPDANTTLIADDAQFRTASTSGSKVYFTDEKDLTPGANAASGAPDLYEAELGSTPGTSPTLRDLSARTLNAEHGEHANVVGVLGASEDGSYVYFAAAGALGGNGAQPQECLPYSEGERNFSKCNVYVAHEGEVKLVAAVTNADGEGGLLTAALFKH